MTADPFHTVAEVGQLCRVDVHKVRSWIESGELVARNLATSKSTRPIYRITPTDLSAFLDGRASKPVTTPKRQSKQRPAVREYV